MDSELNEFTKIVNLINELLITYDETKYTKILDYLSLKNKKNLLDHLISLTDCSLKFQLLGFYYKNLKLYSDSFEWYSLGAKLNNSICISNIAEFYSNGYGVEKDYKIAFEWLKKGVELNDVTCVNNIGMCYHRGNGVEKDYKIALEWFKKGAKLNYAQCIHNIGVYYTSGYGVGKDYKIALEWFRKGAELNNMNCLNNIGLFYEHGYGVEKDFKVALEWFRRGAELNNMNCIDNIGLFYENGYGIEKNYDIALEWYTKGAEQEHGGCINSFIRLFKNDHKIEQIENYKNKINTDIIANYKLGLIYEQQKNTIEALKCFAKIIQIAKFITWKDIAQAKIRNISVNMSVGMALCILKLSEENNKFGKEIDDLRTEILYRPDGAEYLKARESYIESANIIKS